MTAVSLHLGGGGGGVSAAHWDLLPSGYQSKQLCFAHGPQPHPSSGKKILQQSPVEEAEFWALEPETGGDREDVGKGHHNLLTPSLSRGGRRVQGPVS